jgi:plastocyanin
MKTRWAVALAGAIVVAAVLGLGSTASGKGNATTVDVDDDFFTPTSVEIKEDTTVKWNWVGEEVHDVTKVSGPGKFFQSGPEQGSGVLFKQEFKKPGKYEIFCSLHSEEGMRMKLKVKEKKKKNK